MTTEEQQDKRSEYSYDEMPNFDEWTDYELASWTIADKRCVMFLDMSDAGEIGDVQYKTEYRCRAAQEQPFDSLLEAIEDLFMGTRYTMSEMLDLQVKMAKEARETLQKLLGKSPINKNEK